MHQYDQPSVLQQSIGQISLHQYDQPSILQQSIAQISLSSIGFLFFTPKDGTDRPKQIGDDEEEEDEDDGGENTL